MLVCADVAFAGRSLEKYQMCRDICTPACCLLFPVRRRRVQASGIALLMGARYAARGVLFRRDGVEGNSMREHRDRTAHRSSSPESVVGYARLFQLENSSRSSIRRRRPTSAKTGGLCLKRRFRAQRLASYSGRQIADPGQKAPAYGHPENDPLWFLSFESLLKIIFDDRLWPLFECYLTTKELLRAKFSEISPIRNRSGHNRALHEDDLDRIRRLLRDLDQGFWRFCSSFNDKHPFIARSQKLTPFIRISETGMGFDFTEVSPNQWAQVGDTTGMSQMVAVMYSFRPSAGDRSGLVAKGRLYHFTFSLTAHNRHTIDYQRILGIFATVSCDGGLTSSSIRSREVCR